MTTALLSLGSNMGDSRGYLADALRLIGPAVTSSLYRTPPWGLEEQADFLNLAVLVSDPGLDAEGWWQRAQQAERQADRRREIRWGPRTLDVDVIMVWSDEVATAPVFSDDPALMLPHPRAHLRGFVLVPWVEIQPDAVLPGHGPVRDLIAALDAAGELDGIERVGRIGA